MSCEQYKRCAICHAEASEQIMKSFHNSSHH
jgi:hypothetical protein